MPLEFNNDIHEFRYDGRVIPSVTQVLKAAGLIDAQPHDSWYADRGSAIHLATALYDENDLDESSLDPEISPYLEAWKKFLHETNFQFIEKPELQVYSPFGYAGIIDRVALNGKDTCIIDIKSGVSSRWWGLQLAAYAMAYENSRSIKVPNYYFIRRYAVQITKEGTYKLTEFKDRNDFASFAAALTLSNWKGAK